MQFFYLFPFVAVASYAAALPQPAGLSEKYSNNADATLASGLEARSYQPGSNSQKDSATLAELGTLLLSSKIKEVENNHADVPENVKAAGAALSESTGKLLLAYVQYFHYVTNSLKDWVENTGKDIVAVIKSGLGDAEYSKVEPSLKEANEKLTNRANGYLRLVNTALSNIKGRVGTTEKQMETIHESFVNLFEYYTDYFEKLGLQLKKFDAVDHCILCDQQLLSTSIAHLVVECEQVTGHRIQSGLVPAIQKSRLRLLGRALDPGVESVYTWLRGGVLNGEADLDQRWLDGAVEHESMGTRHDNRALAARLADFLQVAYRQYQSTLWKYHRDRLVEVG
ncbi:hypothetical protein BASA50_003807 [Batrachochytrium salamandrivorans]|uniref:Uncharacterized protein n=1 Tax=Batrachochytrium salamandrivorans TaxID=1357716 RepID=A0ABQ8FHJ0_9FUNG|nr:hypothetical protein BASA50_003807 [Batrachochytrium salamandrivorans]